MFNTVIFISLLCFFSFPCSFLHSFFGFGDEYFISFDEFLKSISFWVEGVLEMGSSDSKSNSGVSKSNVDFLINFEMFGLSPSVFFLFTSNFEVQIFNKLFESSDEFCQWSTSLYLEIH